MESIYTIAGRFQIEGEITEIIPWGNGLINHTYRINTNGANDYLLQQMNTYAYPNIDGMMNNINMVTSALNSHQFYFSDGTPKHNIAVIPTCDGKIYYKSQDDRYFRLYNFIRDTYSIERADIPDHAHGAGVILGQFHYLLRDFPVERLNVTVPDFHNPAAHYRNLQNIAADDPLGRCKDVAPELAFFDSCKEYYDYFERCRDAQTLPLRVTHNDTKINNFMYFNGTNESICMVDLDTLMPGYIATDFGDAIRSVMCTGKDSGIYTDISRTVFRRDLYNSYREGFLEGVQGILTPAEEASLAEGAKLICLESGMRYLADYLNGDKYLKIHYQNQNLIKTRMHINLIKDMLDKI